MYYLCTGKNLTDIALIHEQSYFVGATDHHTIHLVYTQDFETLTQLALNLQIAEDITTQYPHKKHIVYAPACFLDEEYLEVKQIEFVGIPYNLFQRERG